MCAPGKVLYCRSCGKNLGGEKEEWRGRILPDSLIKTGAFF